MKAWAPAHITGFFEIHWHDQPDKTGSRGCGLTLTHGVTATTQEGPSTIKLNDRIAEAPTTRSVVEALTTEEVTVELDSMVPIGGGMGVSGAGALGTALALNELLGLNKSLFELAGVAHVAEVQNKTGLGDVVGQAYGGLVLRLEPGAPGIARVDKIPTGDVEISYVSLGAKSTDGVIGEPSMIRRINRAGEKALKEIIKRPTLGRFMRLSREFAVETGLISDRALDVVEAVEARGGLASMAMLGDLVFAIDDDGALGEFGEVRTAGLCHHGAKLL